MCYHFILRSKLNSNGVLLTVSIAARKVAIMRASMDNQNEAGFLDDIALSSSCGMTFSSSLDFESMVQKLRTGLGKEDNGFRVTLHLKGTRSVDDAQEWKRSLKDFRSQLRTPSEPSGAP